MSILNKTAENCPVCGSESGIVSLDAFLNLFYCSDCRHRYSVLSQTDQETYESDYFINAHKNWFNNPNYRLFDYIYKTARTEFGHDGFSVLDVGCGKGDFLNHIARKDSTVDLTGTDLTTIEQPSFSYVKGDFMECTFEDKYDVVVSLAVIEHLDDPRAFTKRIRTLLKPGGLAFIMTNNTESVIYRTAGFMKQFGLRTAFERLYSSHHLNHFSNRSLGRVLHDGGFEVKSIKNHNYPLKAVDVPPAPSPLRMGYKLAVSLMFLVSIPLDAGFLQTAVCRPR